MASTTKTTNLKLSQFVGTDKPAWLTDYNGDMQKIDNGYKKLEDANVATQADLDLTKTDLETTKTDITNMEAEIQTLEAGDNTITQRVTVLEANYDTMHHEVAINTDNIATNEESIKTNATNITTINKKLKGQEAIDGIKYNITPTDKIKSFEIRPAGSNLDLVVTTANDTLKYVHLYDYNDNLILPDFYSNLKFEAAETESFTLAAGEEKNIILPIGADIICATNVTCNNADVRCFSFFLEKSQTTNAKINFWIKNYGSSSWTGTAWYTCLRAVKKGVAI